MIRIQQGQLAEELARAELQLLFAQGHRNGPLLDHEKTRPFPARLHENLSCRRGEVLHRVQHPLERLLGDVSEQRDGTQPGDARRPQILRHSAVIPRTTARFRAGRGKTCLNASVVGKRLTLLAVTLASGTVFLDTTIVTVALPKIGEELPAAFAEVLEGQSYVYYAYLLTLSALLIPAGAVTDTYGRKRVFALGLVAFGVTSALCGLATNMEMLVLMRALQGAAGAFLVPGSLALITATFHGEERGRAFGIWAAASGATTVIGPIIGAGLIHYFSWRAAFFINVPLLAIAIFATARGVEESKSNETVGSFDFIGAVTVAVALGGLTFGTIRGQAQEWKDPAAFAALGLGAAASVAFPVMMKKARSPLVPPALFRSRNFTVVNLTTFLIYGALYLRVQYLALFAIGVLGYNEIGFAVAVLPAPLLLALFSSRFGSLAARLGPRRFMVLGPLLMAAATAWYVRFPRNSEPWRADAATPASFVPPGDYFTDLLPAELLFGVGLAVMVAPLTTALMQSVPQVHAGLASAINNSISRIGPQLLGAAIFIVVTATFYGALEQGLPAGRYEPAAVREAVSPLNAPPRDVDPTIAQVAVGASGNAFRASMLWAAALFVAGAAVNAVGIRDDQALTPQDSR